jgi:hypothetical protein
MKSLRDQVDLQSESAKFADVMPSEFHLNPCETTRNYASTPELASGSALV